jgi:hypothetical protein
MSDLFLVAKAYEVLGSEATERDQFWINACKRNNVDFAQIKPSRIPLVPEPAIEEVATSPSVVPDAPKLKRQPNTAGPVAGELPGLSMQGDRSRLQDPQAASGASFPNKPQRPVTAADTRNILAVHGISPGLWAPDGGILPSTTAVDKSRDPRLNRGATDTHTVCSGPPCVKPERRRPDDHRQPGAHRDSGDVNRLAVTFSMPHSARPRQLLNGFDVAIGFDGSPIPNNVIDRSQDPHRVWAHGRGESRPTEISHRLEESRRQAESGRREEARRRDQSRSRSQSRPRGHSHRADQSHLKNEYSPSYEYPPSDDYRRWGEYTPRGRPKDRHRLPNKYPWEGGSRRRDQSRLGDEYPPGSGYPPRNDPPKNEYPFRNGYSPRNEYLDDDTPRGRPNEHYRLANEYLSGGESRRSRSPRAISHHRTTSHHRAVRSSAHAIQLQLQAQLLGTNNFDRDISLADQE